MVGHMLSKPAQVARPASATPPAISGIIGTILQSIHHRGTETLRKSGPKSERQKQPRIPLSGTDDTDKKRILKGKRNRGLRGSDARRKSKAKAKTKAKATTD